MKSGSRIPLPGATEPAQSDPPRSLRGQSSPKRLGETQAFKDVQTKGRVKHLDAIVRTGESMSRAVNALDRTQLRALADRMDVLDSLATPQLRKVLKRRLVDAGGLVRESRAK